MKKSLLQKIFLILFLFFNSFSKERQCIVCICEKNKEVIISDPFCNYEDPKLAIHQFTQRTLRDEDADKLCKNCCNQMQYQYKGRQIWQNK